MILEAIERETSTTKVSIERDCQSYNSLDGRDRSYSYFRHCARGLTQSCHSRRRALQVHKLLLRDKRCPPLQVPRSQHGTSGPIGSIAGHQSSGKWLWQVRWRNSCGSRQALRLQDGELNLQRRHCIAWPGEHARNGN